MTKHTQAQIDASLAKLQADIAIAVESATTMRTKVQHALVGCVSHWATTGSNTGLADIANLFLTELGQGVNLQAVKSWMEEHLHMIEHTDGKKMVFTPVKSSDLDTKKAAGDMWYTHRPQTVFSFDLAAMIIGLAKKAANAQKKGEGDADMDVTIDPDLYVMLQNMSIKAQEVPKPAPVAKELEGTV